ncbi:MAG: gliding motility protein GldL [Flavobacteriales bacterium]|nr:gliding motility protein GldL [Bacteroidota bacterium]MCB9239963.1 gliding motility protein GldL [Flavobacteriales bacterium]
MAYAYGWGASIVIIGALFKILHIKGADLWLIIGMTTEAVIFFLSAFEPIHEELDWTLVYPELAGMEGEGSKDSTASVSQQLDSMLANAKVGPELIEGLGTGLRSLSDNVGNMADLSGATVATKEYAENISKASTALGSMSNSYSRAIEALDSLADSTEAFKSSTSSILNVNNNLAELDQNLQALNSIYGGMLSAMRPK